jgi:aminopeptidase YwaD
VQPGKRKSGEKKWPGCFARDDRFLFGGRVGNGIVAPCFASFGSGSFLMKRIAVLGTAAGMLLGVGAWGQKPPLLPEKDVAALANEISGETAKRNLEGLARFHRQRGSKGFHEAAELVAERLRVYGLSDVAILQFPADGKIFYGTQRSRPAWDVEFAELWELKNGEESLRLGSYEAEPVVLAEDSESADVTAELVDVSEGTKESDYAGKQVKGKIVLVSAQPGAVQDLGVGKYGAAGIVSYAQNQMTAWSGENPDAIRWGHLETFSANKTFGFMVSLQTARALRARLEKGEKIRLHAVVKASQHPGNYELVTATIAGADPRLQEQEVVFSCHLDHQRPGANDNASGCSAILEVARTLQKLIGEKKLEPPARTIRFVFPPEIEGTMALLNGHGQYASSNASDGSSKKSIGASDNLLTGPELVKRIKAVVHMDMVGGGPETRAVFHVTRGPMSLPSFVHDIAWAFAEWVNQESYEYAATGNAEYPLVSLEGGREPLRAVYSAYSMGSDHDVYQDSSYGIPAIYLNDWPDRFIHTNLDTAANIDPTKLKRAAFIGAATGYFMAADPRRSPLDQVSAGQMFRAIELQQRVRQVDEQEGQVLKQSFFKTETEILDSLPPAEGKSIAHGELKFQTIAPMKLLCSESQVKKPVSGVGLLKFRRDPQSKGPMAVFGYDDFEAEWTKRGHERKPKLLEYAGLWGGGEEYAYEVLNFADGKRNAQEIRDAVAAEYGPVPLELVVEYLKALQEIAVVEVVR